MRRHNFVHAPTKRTARRSLCAICGLERVSFGLLDVKYEARAVVQLFRNASHEWHEYPRPCLERQARR